MKHGLFRQEVIETRRGSWLGSVHAAPPLSRWALVLLAIGLACAIVALLICGHYTRRARVMGLLVPSPGLQTIEANLSGSVSDVLVKEGQQVRKGQPVVMLSGDANSVAMGEVHADITRRLRAQQARYESDRLALKRSMNERRNELVQQLTVYKAQYKQVKGQLDLQRQRSKSDLALLRRIEPLGKKGYVSAIHIEQQRAQALQDRVQVRGSERQRLGLIQQIAATKRKLAQIPLEMTTRINAIDRKLDDIGQQLARNEAQRSVVLRAPSSGMVSSLLAVPGKAVRAGETLLSIVPAGSHLQAQLLVPSRAVGFIRPESRVVLRYQSFPYQKFGQRYGRISSISHSALGPAELYALTGQRTEEPMYRVIVRLDSQRIMAYGKQVPLMPGMSLEADILLDRRSLLEWIFEPLYGMRQRLVTAESPNG